MVKNQVLTNPDRSCARCWIVICLLTNSDLFRLVLTPKTGYNFWAWPYSAELSRPVHPSVLPCSSAHMAFPYCPSSVQILSTWRCPVPWLLVFLFYLYHQILSGASGTDPPSSCCTSGSAPPPMQGTPLLWWFPNTCRRKANPLPTIWVHNYRGLLTSTVWSFIYLLLS